MDGEERAWGQGVCGCVCVCVYDGNVCVGVISVCVSVPVGV